MVAVKKDAEVIAQEVVSILQLADSKVSQSL